MIKEAFGLLKFSELTARQAEIRFNALDGSNSRPRALFSEDYGDDKELKKYIAENIYFGEL